MHIHTYFTFFWFLTDTTAILRSQEAFWPGVYEVEFVVKDQQGHACPEPQRMTVQVCTCENGVVCGNQGSNGRGRKTTSLGPAGIGLILAGLLLLLSKHYVIFFLFENFDKIKKDNERIILILEP